MGAETDALRCGGEASEVVSEFEVEGKRGGVDIGVLIARAQIVVNFDTVKDKEGTVNVFWRKPEKMTLRSGLS